MLDDMDFSDEVAHSTAYTTRLQSATRRQKLAAAASAGPQRSTAARWDSTNSRPVTRLQAAKSAKSLANDVLHSSSNAAAAVAVNAICSRKRPRGAEEASEESAESSCSCSCHAHELSCRIHTAAEESPLKRQKATSKQISTRALVDTVIADPAGPQSLQMAVRVLQSVWVAPLLSQPFWRAAGAMLKLAKLAPMVLLQAVLKDPSSLQHILHTLHCGSPLAAHTAALCVANLAKAATEPSGAIPPGAFLALLLAEHQQGLLLVLKGMHVCQDNVALASASALAFLSRSAAAPLAGAEQQQQPAPGTLLLQALLQRQQQGLQLLLEALNEDRTAEATAFAVKGLASAEPAGLLAALLHPQQRRGLQYLLRALSSGSDRRATKVYEALVLLAQAASPTQLAGLLQHVLRCMRQGCLGAARLTWAISQMQHGQHVLKLHVHQLLQMLQQQGPCQAAAAAALWHVAESPGGGQALAAHSLMPLLRAMLLGGEVAVMAACIVCYLTLTEAALHQLVPHVPDLLKATQQQQPAPVVSMAIRSIYCISTTGGSSGQQEVLRNIPGMLSVMQQSRHPDAAAVAGNTVLALLHTDAGKAAFTQEQHVDALLVVLQRRTPAMLHAARALAHIAASSTAGKAVLLHPHRLELMHETHTLLPALQALTSHQAAYEAFAPLFWVLVAAGTMQVVPPFLGKLVAAMSHTNLTMPCFDALTHMTSFRAGLLALAPYLPSIREALTACLQDERFIINQAALEQYMAWMTGKICAVVVNLQHQQRLAEAGLQRSALLLAQQQRSMTGDSGGSSGTVISKKRKWGSNNRHQQQKAASNRQQEVLRMLLLSRFDSSWQLNTQLLQQLQKVRSPPCFD